jgi:hypothetical protein
MLGYRLYRFDKAGHFNWSEVIPAETDTSAMRTACQLLAGAAGELWLDEKLVSRLGTKPSH